MISILLLDLYTLRLRLTLTSNVCNVIQLFRGILIGFADLPLFPRFVHNNQLSSVQEEDLWVLNNLQQLYVQNNWYMKTSVYIYGSHLMILLYSLFAYT